MFSVVLVNLLITIVFLVSLLDYYSLSDYYYYYSLLDYYSCIFIRLLLEWYATPEKNTWGAIAANCSVMGFITDKQFKLFAVGNELEINPNNFQSSALCSANTKKFKYSISPFHSQDLKVNSPNQNHTFCANWSWEIWSYIKPTILIMFFILVTRLPSKL